MKEQGFKESAKLVKARYYEKNYIHHYLIPTTIL